MPMELLPVLRLVLRMVSHLAPRVTLCANDARLLQALISSDLDSDLDYVQGSLMVLGATAPAKTADMRPRSAPKRAYSTDSASYRVRTGQGRVRPRKH